MTSRIDEARLRWQCRRGMAELDVLLTRYVENDYRHASNDNKQAFRELLALADPELVGYFLGGQMPRDAALASVVSQIRDRPYA